MDRVGLNFFPGIAGERLAEIAEGKTKTGAIRELIAATPWPSKKDFSPYVQLTRIGRAIKEQWKSFKDVSRLATLALEASRSFKYEAEAGGTIPKAGRGAASFRLNLSKDDALKLKVLGEQAGFSKTMTLRYLILGLPLPDRLALRTAGRMGQIGGLLRHVAYAHKSKAWEPVIRTSRDISRIALGLLMAENAKTSLEAFQ